MKLAIICACLLLAACGESQDEARGEAGAETPFDPLVDQLDRAKAVEETVEQHKRELDEAIEKTDGESG